MPRFHFDISEDHHFARDSFMSGVADNVAIEVREDGAPLLPA